MKNNEQQLKELIAPYLDELKAIQAKRPNVNWSGARITLSLSDANKCDFSGTLFFDEDKDCIGSYCHEKIESVFEAINRRVDNLPKPPTRAELIAQKQAELAALLSETQET